MPKIRTATAHRQPPTVLVKRVVYTAVLGCSAALLALVAAQAALDTPPLAEKVYLAERVELPCQLTPGGDFGTVDVAIGNASGRAVPKGWPVQYQLVNDKRAPRYSVRFEEGVPDKGSARGRARGVGLHAGPCFAWTILKKEPAQLVDAPR